MEAVLMANLSVRAGMMDATPPSRKSDVRRNWNHRVTESTERIEKILI